MSLSASNVGILSCASMPLRINFFQKDTKNIAGTRTLIDDAQIVAAKFRLKLHCFKRQHCSAVSAYRYCVV